MGKQIKIGHDKTVAPITKQFKQLIDIEGEPLFDAAGNKLVTEENAALGIFTNSETALPIFVNNSGVSEAVKVIEQFPEVSAVSNSLLGVPRSEEQLSLFSDVASYGLDEANWNADSFKSRGQRPNEWYKKKHPIHGRRLITPDVFEGTYEQALYLKNFPSQYDWPGSTIEERRTEPTEQFKLYMNFILMGKYLYKEFNKHEETKQFAEDFFLDNSVYFLKSDGTRDTRFDFVADLNNDGITDLTIAIEDNIIFNTADLVFENSSDLHDVGYTDFYQTGVQTVSLQDAFDKIEAWTYMFGLIVGGNAKFPVLSGNQNQSIGGVIITTFETSDLFSSIQSFCTTKARPGGNSDMIRMVTLESTDTFRYQPGRVSGFTFGSRMKNDSSSTANLIEWGCSNDTDEYMFQLRGSEFNIVRRSVLPMGAESLIKQGLDASLEKTVLQKGVSAKTKTVFETIIPRSKFNGDALLGSGKSGYVLTFDDVAMYKIEFSWYGAIGAKFYAYVPTGVGDARWVLMHTLIIENSMNKPVLQNPDFKFKYFIYSSESSGYTEPTYLYKYGSSYYIDGGDEGTTNITTVSSPSKSFVKEYSATNKIGTPIIGIKPKTGIRSASNSGYGNTATEVTNFRKIYPLTVSATATQNSRVDVVSITGGPDGAHYCFQPCLTANGNVTPSNRKGIQLRFNGDGDELTLADDTLEVFEARDVGAKVVADGIYNVYISGNIADTNKSAVFRRDIQNGETTYATLVSGRSGRQGSVRAFEKSDGSVVEVNANTLPTITANLSNYDAIIPSSIPINSAKFKIHFLNPQAKDTTHSTNRHFAEFAVGVTTHEPIVDSGELKYVVDGDTANPQTKDQVDPVNSFPIAEYCPRDVFIDTVIKAETEEQDRGYGQQLSVNPRAPSPRGSNSGFVSCVQGEIEITGHSLLKSFRILDNTDEFFDTFRLVLNQNAGGPDSGLFDNGISGASTIVYPTALPKGVKLPSSPTETTQYESEVGTSDGRSFSESPDFKVYLVSDVFTDDSSGTKTGVPNSKYIHVNSKLIIPSDGAGFQLLSYPGIDQTDQNFATHTLSKNPFIFTTRTLTLQDDFKVEAFDESGNEIFPYRTFKRIQALKFGGNKLYPFFAMRDHAKINNISVQEIFPSYSVTHTPKLSDFAALNSAVTLSFPEGSAEDKTPASFNEEDTLSSSLFDLSTLNPLRPGDTLYSFYLKANEPDKINLSNVFNTDRLRVSTGLYNNKAIYFTIKGLESAGTGEMSVTVKEQ